jgi:hypothetical protein
MHLLYEYNNVAYNTVDCIFTKNLSQRNNNFDIFLRCVCCGGTWTSLAVNREQILAALKLCKGTTVAEKGKQSANTRTSDLLFQIIQSWEPVFEKSKNVGKKVVKEGEVSSTCGHV